MEMSILPGVIYSSRIPRLVVPAVFFILVAAAAARGDTVTIHNERSDTVQVCVYSALVVLGGGEVRAHDGPPLACWVLAPKKSVRWNRARTSGYNLTVSRPNTDVTLCKSAPVPMGPALTIGPACQLNAIAPEPPPRPKPTPMTPKPVSPKPVVPKPGPPIATKPKPVPPAAPKPAPIHYPDVTLIGPALSWKVGAKDAPKLPEKADENVIFVNKTGETLKVCVYRSSAITDVIPVSCWDIGSGRQYSYYRGEFRHNLHVRVFRRGILDTLLCTGQFSGSPLWVYIDPGCKVRDDDGTNKKVRWQDTKAFFQVCNRFAEQRVRFAIGNFVEYVGPNLDTEGWYLLEPEQCLLFNMTNRLLKVRDPAWTQPRGMPAFSFLIYGETTDAFWGGGPTNWDFCLQREGNFHYKQLPQKPGECSAPNQMRVKFRAVTSQSESKRDSVIYYYWNF